MKVTHHEPTIDHDTFEPRFTVTLEFTGTQIDDYNFRHCSEDLRQDFKEAYITEFVRAVFEPIFHKDY